MKLRIGLIAVLIYPFLNTLQAQGTQDTAIYRFSVQQCVDYAARNNVQVRNALLDFKLQEQTNRGITGMALPTLSATAGLTDYTNLPTSLLPGEFFGQPAGTFVPLKFGTKYNANAGITLQQVLFDGQVFVGLQARRTSLDWAQKNIEVTQEAIKTNIYKIYYQLAVSKTQIALLDANITRSQKLYNDSKALYENGFAEKTDVDRASVQLANLETEKFTTQNTIDNGYLGLKLLMGMPIADSLVLTDQITDDKIKEGLLNEGIYQYGDRKDFQYASLGIKLDQYNVKRYKLSYLPTLNLNGSLAKTAQRTKFDIFGPGSWFTTTYFGVSMNIPIFDGFQREANIEKAKLQLQEAQNQLDNLKMSIDNDVKVATNNFHNAITTMDFQKKNMQLAEQVYDQTKKKYEAGTGSTTDITNAETDLKSAQTNYINALYDAIIAKVDYLKAIGKL